MGAHPIRALDTSLDVSIDVPRDSAATAVTALVEAHYAPLCDFVFPMVGSRAAAEDLVQDLFVKLWQRWPEWVPREPIPYLYRSARYLAMNHRRHERVVARGAAVLMDAPRGTSTDAASDRVHAQDVSVAIEQALEALPEGQRQIFFLSRQQELTYAQIASVLEISVKTVETQMNRALKTLKLHLASFLSAVTLVLMVTGR